MAAGFFRRFALLLTKAVINALALIVVDALFTGVWLESTGATIAAAALLVLVNTYLRPLLLVFTLPLNVLTLGLFTLVINALLLRLVSWVVPSFHVAGFWTAVGAALVVSTISLLLNWFIRPGEVRVRVHRNW